MSAIDPIRQRAETTIDLPRMALSVRQPWAFALAIGWKPVENRSWRRDNPGINFRGPFCIHAAKSMTRGEYENAADLFARLGFTCPPASDLQRGGIIGHARLIDIVSDHDSPWFSGPKGLVIADAKPVNFIPVGGNLGFFDWRKLMQFAKHDAPEPPAKWMLSEKPTPSRAMESNQPNLF